MTESGSEVQPRVWKELLSHCCRGPHEVYEGEAWNAWHVSLLAKVSESCMLVQAYTLSDSGPQVYIILFLVAMDDTTKNPNSNPQNHWQPRLRASTYLANALFIILLIYTAQFFTRIRRQT